MYENSLVFKWSFHLVRSEIYVNSEIQYLGVDVTYRNDQINKKWKFYIWTTSLSARPRSVANKCLLQVDWTFKTIYILLVSLQAEVCSPSRKMKACGTGNAK